MSNKAEDLIKHSESIFRAWNRGRENIEGRDLFEEIKKQIDRHISQAAVRGFDVTTPEGVMAERFDSGIVDYTTNILRTKD